MKLLHWCTLEPQRPSGLAAIRFTAPVRVSKIRVFPNGAQPFAQCPDVVARTHPDSFFLDVFFNAMPINPAESKEKQRAPNALVPTTIAYAGGQVDFTVDLGTEYASRLMIVKGQFDALSLAIYGDVVSESQPSSEGLTHKTVPANEPIPLSKALDPANAEDPTSLATNLLSTIEDAPPLSLVTRLMFCLKPANEDWDDSRFPYLFADLEQACAAEEFTLDVAVDVLHRPVSDSIPEDILTKFVECISATIGPKDPDQSFLVAKIFRISASQLPSLSLKLCHCIEPSHVFDSSSMDEDTILELLDASANPDIARHLNTTSFLDTLRDIQESAQHDRATQVAARRLLARISAWDAFEDALTNTQADLTESIAMLRDIGAEEQSLGIWLMSMTQHDDLLTKMSENPVFSSTHSYPRLFSSIRNLRNGSGVAVSHDDFITFIRAFIGVTSVLAVWAWADSLAHDMSRERALGVLHLWQGVDGYREIVDYLLLLPQLSKRLGWIISDKVEVPRKSTIFGEKILVELCKDPDAFLHFDLVDTILSIEPPLCFIPETERLTIRKIALVADDGLHAAVDELTYANDHPLSLRRLRTLRVSIAILEKHLKNDDDGEWKLLQAIWDDHSVALLPRLVDVFVEVAIDLNQHFVVTAAPPPKNQPLVAQLFRCAEDLLRLLFRLTPRFTLIARSLRILTLGIADVFACTDVADTIYSQNSSACTSAQSMRQTCLDVIHKFSEPGFIVEPEKLGAEVVLRTLFNHGVDGSRGRDPAYHLLQMFTLVDHVLPEPSYRPFENGFEDGSYKEDEQLTNWVLSVLPNVLNEAQKFFRSLDVENEVHFMRRLVKLDGDGLVGIGEWFLIEELKHLLQLMQSLSILTTSPDERAVLQYQVSSSLLFLYLLMKPSSNTSDWCIQAISSIADVSLYLTLCLKELVSSRVVSSHLNNIAEILASRSSSFNEELNGAIILSALMTLRQDTSKQLWSPVADLLKVATIEDPDALRTELGHALTAVVQSQVLDAGPATAVVSVLEWLIAQPDTKYTILYIKNDDLTSLYDLLHGALPGTDAPRLETLKTKFTVDEDESLTEADTIVSDSLELTLAGVEDLLRPTPVHVEAPSTPKRDTPDLFGLVLSPPTAILRSSTTTGLTKTYFNNDFRDLRQTPSARQNTSRLPSMHVDVGINGQ
ncbi:hypothetical protein K435DRAFT_3799 [Dendrothele bispora CBS 962.96]|uniref:Virilizer N-terminal domain-containing protein n=1 Tax=Dendrothele bispora (strain CBS 962.96) TaxID=1314807 RepID=A0A4S8MXS8_DENBC|nr:hypothetical protein K435DRAFT_3799 [Dendrothele bispora CBS 962.96]